MTAQFVGRILNGKRLPELEELIPSIAADKPQLTQEEKEEWEWKAQKMRMMNFAMNHNRGGATK